MKKNQSCFLEAEMKCKKSFVSQLWLRTKGARSSLAGSNRMVDTIGYKKVPII